MTEDSKTEHPTTDKTYTLLIVDNNAVNVGMLFDYLHENGFRVLVARDGESAIERARLAQPDLILLDVLMPGIDGFETCRRLQADPSTKEIPVIFMTGLTYIEDKSRAFEAGGVDYLTKPLQLTEVYQRIMIHLRLRGLVRELKEANNILFQRASYLEISRQVGQQVTVLLDLDELLPQVVRIIQDKFGYNQVSIWLPDENREYLTLKAFVCKAAQSVQVDRIAIDLSQGIIANAFMMKKEHQINDSRINHANPQDIKNQNMEYAELAIPLIVGTNVLGILDVVVNQPGGFVPEESVLLQSLANQIAIAIRNAQLYKVERQRLFDIEAVNRELETFSYSVSHDLRAPLRAIHGFCRVLEDDYIQYLPEDGKHVFQRVYHNTQRMSQLIDDLLAFSRLGRQPIKKSSFQSMDIITQTWEELRQQEADRRITFTVGEMPPCLADPSLLKQVWVNLLSNALKYTRARPVSEIEVGCLPIQDGQDHIYYIKDNGVGFDMKYADNLFGVFQRLHTEQEFEGTGVGLAIVARIIHRHGGKVWADALVDQGATFYFSLPE